MGRRTASKTAAKTAAKTAVAKVAQAHGGALYAGGVPGNSGGSGRPRSEVRAAALAGAAKAIPRLVAQLDSHTPSVVQGAADKLLKYGLGTADDSSVPADDVRGRLSKSMDTIRRLAPPRLAMQIFAEMKEHWT